MRKFGSIGQKNNVQKLAGFCVPTQIHTGPNFHPMLVTWGERIPQAYPPPTHENPHHLRFAAQKQYPLSGEHSGLTDASNLACGEWIIIIICSFFLSSCFLLNLGGGPELSPKSSQGPAGTQDRQDQLGSVLMVFKHPLPRGILNYVPPGERKGSDDLSSAREEEDCDASLSAAAAAASLRRCS